jgi:hypothetical protein
MPSSTDEQPDRHGIAFCDLFGLADTRFDGQQNSDPSWATERSFMLRVPMIHQEMLVLLPAPRRKDFLKNYSTSRRK